MTRTRVTHARDTGARNNARDEVCHRAIEATRARVPPPPPPPWPLWPQRARDGDDGGDDERVAGVRNDAHSSDARARRSSAR